MDKAQAIVALRKIADAVVETVNEQPNGAPAGAMYSAFMAHGMTLDQFQQITGILVDAGRIKRRGNLFFPA